MTTPRLSRLQLAFMIAVPLAWAGLLMFHPNPTRDIHAGLHDEANTWMIVHVGTLVFIGLIGAVLLLLEHRQGELDCTDPGRRQCAQRGIRKPVDALERRQLVRPEADRVIVSLIERDPHDARRLLRLCPLGHQGGLAPAGRRDDQQQTYAGAG